MKKKKAEDAPDDGRYIRLPVELWDSLEIDAKRCRRSVTKQIETILVDYFKLANVELYTTQANQHSPTESDVVPMVPHKTKVG